MSAEIVSLAKPAPHRLEVGIRWPHEVVHYQLTEVATPLAPVIEFDERFHRDFSSRPDARMRVLEIARRAFREEEVRLPVAVAAGTAYEVGGFRFASGAGLVGAGREGRPADAPGREGGPADAPGRDRVTDPRRRERILTYLRGGARLPSGHRTDGRWIWPDAVIDELAHHGVAPEPELAERIAELGYYCPAVTEQMVAAAREALRRRANG